MTAPSPPARTSGPGADWLPELVDDHELARVLWQTPQGLAKAIRAGTIPKPAFTCSRGRRWWAKQRIINHLMGDSPQPS